MLPTTASPDQPTDEASLEFLRSASGPEWREQALGYESVSAWESENRVVLPEPYRSSVAAIANGSSPGPPEDGGLLPLGWLRSHPSPTRPEAMQVTLRQRRTGASPNGPRMVDVPRELR
jgi:hypothetical protein